MTLWSIQVDVDVPAAARAVQVAHEARHDPGFLLKTVLTETFAGPAVRPWVLHRQAGHVVSILGYATTPIEELRERAALALPGLRAAIVGLHGHALPPLRNGQRLRFSVQLCPTLHITRREDRSRRHGERDAFLAAVDRGETGIEREGVYSRFLAERLVGATLDLVHLTGFRLMPVTRPHRGADAP